MAMRQGVQRIATPVLFCTVNYSAFEKEGAVKKSIDSVGADAYHAARQRKLNNYTYPRQIRYICAFFAGDFCIFSICSMQAAEGVGPYIYRFIW